MESGSRSAFARRLSKRQRVLTSAYLYNPGLVGSWFVVTGIFGLLLILNGSIVAATSMVKEREAGTIEQLLMSPAGTYEIIIAKIFPLFLVLFVMVLVATLMIKVVFNVPFEGSIITLFAGAALCVLSGIGIGTVIATLHAFGAAGATHQLFVNPLLTTVSGAITPSEAIPAWLRPLSTSIRSIISA